MRGARVVVGARAKEQEFLDAKAKVLKALTRGPMSPGRILTHVIRNTAYCLPELRDQLLERMVTAGEIVVELKPGSEVKRHYRLPAHAKGGGE